MEVAKMQTCVTGSTAGWVDARAGGGVSCGGRRAGVAATPSVAAARGAVAVFKPAGGRFFAQRKEQPKHNLLPMSMATSSYGDDDDAKFASRPFQQPSQEPSQQPFQQPFQRPSFQRVKELHDVNTARSDDANVDPVSATHPLSPAALQTALGPRFQSVFRLMQTSGGLLANLLGGTLPRCKRDEALLSESGAFCSMAMSAGVFGVALTDLSGNLVFMSAFWAWLTAQILKYVTTFYKEGRWDWRVMFDSGGMPSSHTALVVGLTTGIAYQYGLGSTLFPLSLAFSLIVMYDAAGVRRHAGKQAVVLNKILESVFHGESISEDKLKEVLGHSPLQVLAGAALGVFIGVMYMHTFGAGYAALA